MNDLIAVQLQILYSIETQLTEALPTLADRATGQELRDAILTHVEETKEQARRLEGVAGRMGISLGGMNDEVMASILKAGQTLIEQTTDTNLIDMEILGGGTKVEHYEMAVYEGVINLLNKSDQKELADILSDSLNEEETAARKMKMISMGGLGKLAAEAM